MYGVAKQFATQYLGICTQEFVGVASVFGMDNSSFAHSRLLNGCTNIFSGTNYKTPMYNHSNECSERLYYDMLILFKICHMWCINMIINELKGQGQYKLR